MRTTAVNFILAGAFLLLAPSVFSQTPVVIKGRFEPAIENTQLSVYKPNAGYFNVFYPDMESETTIQNGEFLVRVNLDKAGFVRILSKGMPKTYFYAEPGDSIHVTFVTDSAGGSQTLYSGNNAGANNLLARFQLLNNNQSTLQNSRNRILSILQAGKTAEETLQQLDQEIQTCIQPLHELLKDGKITKSCYDAFVSETEQKMLSWAAPYLRDYFGGNGTGAATEKMKQVAERLFDRYDPYHSTHFVATTNSSNSHIKSILRKKGVLPVAQLTEPLWAPWDTKLGMVASEVASLDYAPAPTQMLFLGNALLAATVFKPLTDAEFSEVFNVYYSKFPQSPYIPLLTAYLAQSNSTAGSVQAPLRFGVYQLGDKNSKLAEQAFPGVDTITHFQTLIQQYFKGSPVFVDFWATWCSPCIAEFRNEPTLHKFLEANKVKVLYVSIDNPRAVDNWKKMAEKYGLKGFHYLVSPEVYDNLNKWFVGIPRYMLFNAKGEVLHDNLLRPSNGDALFKQISQLLKK